MWQLESIKAKNLCAFEDLNYTLQQGQTTLVFGNNMDDESQNSNGSGKSALIEAMAISLTGETLRKVNMDEIINDAYDTAELTAVLNNLSENCKMVINRVLTRKKAQTVAVVFTRNGKEEEIKQPSVAEYNKFVLDTIGLTKDDIFSNFILTAKKYRSFLSSTDREKKELINRFSNGIMVDESIEALHNDMAPIQEDVFKAEMQVAEYNGKVSAMNEEIERATTESTNRSQNKKIRIEEWKNSIASERAEIRKFKEKITSCNSRLDILDTLDAKMQKVESGKYDFQKAYELIKQEFTTANLSPINDYQASFASLQKDHTTYQKDLDKVSAEIKVSKKELDKAEKEFVKLSSSFDKTMERLDSKDKKTEDEIKKLIEEVKELQSKEQDLSEERDKINRNISELYKQLAGVIVCPKCHHEFTLANNLDIEETRDKLKKEEKKASSLEDDIKLTHKQCDESIAAGKKKREEQNAIADERASEKQTFQDVKDSLNKLRDKYADIQRELNSIQSKLDATSKQLDNLKADMFDDVFDAIDHETALLESDIKSNKLEIENREGAIKSYQESIEKIENAAETDIIASLKKSKEEYQKALQEAVQDKENVERQLNELKVQENTFVEFKTHLANTKIEAISQITNDFLETIGSDIRVSFSGYTVLKSGKVRDKISISLMRDGADCGSFDKFSRGEQTRVELACVLAMHELINMNCSDGQGLNLLVIDEILDAADEQGLMNVFKALNETHITSLVVSHGNIAENYPNRLIINKQNGVSFI